MLVYLCNKIVHMRQVGWYLLFQTLESTHLSLLQNNTKFRYFVRMLFRYMSRVIKDGSRHKNLCMTRVLGFLIRYFSNYYTLHRSDLAARAAPLDPRLVITSQPKSNFILSSLHFWVAIWFCIYLYQVWGLKGYPLKLYYSPVF